MSALPPKANVKRPATLKGPFHALAKITSFLAKYRKTLLLTPFKNAAMKTQRNLMQQVDARGVVFGLFAIIVICAAIWAGTYLW